MKHLTIDVVKSGSNWSALFEGQCSTHALRSMPLTEFLALELMSRVQGDGLLPLLQEAFVALATAGNDEASKQVLATLHKIMVPLRGKNADQCSLTYEAFIKRRRAEELVFLRWLDSVYWQFPLYQIYTEHATLGGGVKYGNPLKGLKLWVAVTVVQMWDRCDDQLGRRAFKFLCDSVDDKRFFKRATNITSSFFLRSGPHSVQAEDKNPLLQAMRERMSRNLEVIVLWLSKVQDDGPWEMRKLLGHAFVNAGGKIAAQE